MTNLQRGRCLFSLFVAPFCANAQLSFDPAVALGNVNTPKVTEASGIAVSARTPGVFWTHNDGSKDHVYAFAMNGSLLADIDFSKNPDDIEDIAVGPGPTAGVSYLYIGDIGSNTADRKTVHVYRLVEPAVDVSRAANPVSQTVEDGVANFELSYPSGAFDAEAMFVDPLGRMLYIVTKEEAQALVFRISIDQLADDQTRPLEFVKIIPIGEVNAATISADGKTIALRREDAAVAWIRNSGESVTDALSRAGTPIPVVGPPNEPNGESISFLPDNSGYVTVSEGEGEEIYFFRRQAPVGCNEAPRFSQAPRLSGESLLLTFVGCPGSTVIVERTAGFNGWQQAGSVRLDNGTGTFSDSTGGTAGFFRLRQQ